MTTAQYFLEHVLPQLPDDQREQISASYPHVRFTPRAGDVSVGSLPVLMLVALTGTGKTTTLRALSELDTVPYSDHLPGRREIANLIVIPTAQALLGETIAPVSDRERRFFYTHTFAAHVAGGFATAYRWLYTAPAPIPIISEGIRGADEIAHALDHSPRWHIVELALDPVTRLQRLSRRDDPFDHIATGSETPDLTFLPPRHHAAVHDHLAAGTITPGALRIMRAETQNYGLEGYTGTHPRYHRLQVDNLPPHAVAQAIAHQLEAITTHA